MKPEETSWPEVAKRFALEFRKTCQDISRQIVQMESLADSFKDNSVLLKDAREILRHWYKERKEYVRTIAHYEEFDREMHNREWYGIRTSPKP